VWSHYPDQPLQIQSAAERDTGWDFCDVQLSHITVTNLTFKAATG